MTVSSWKWHPAIFATNPVQEGDTMPHAGAAVAKSPNWGTVRVLRNLLPDTMLTEVTLLSGCVHPPFTREGMRSIITGVEGIVSVAFDGRTSFTVGVGERTTAPSGTVVEVVNQSSKLAIFTIQLVKEESSSDA